MKISPRLSILSLVLFGWLLLSSEGAPIRITHTRYELTQPSDDKVLTLDTAEIWRGVILQALARLQDGTGSEIDAKAVTLEAHDSATGRLYLGYRGSRYSLAISEDFLARIISWLDNGGTGIFTANELTAAKAKEAGVTEVAPDEWVASEFVGSPIVALSRYLDFPEEVLVYEPGNMDGLLETHNDGLSELDVTRERDYIVADLDSGFRVIFEDGNVLLKGTMYRYHRSEVDGSRRVFVTSIDAFSEDSIPKLRHSMRLKQMIMPGARQGSPDETAKQHSDALRLARLVAMLRTIRSKNPENWKAFGDRFFAASPEK